MIEYWSNFYKWQNGTRMVANLIYEPLINPAKTIFRMNFNPNQYAASNLSDSERQKFFEDEVNNIVKVSGTSYAPEIIDIDRKNRLIDFKWYDRSVSEMIHTGAIKEIPNWQQQIKNVLKDICDKNLRKINIYPHTFYLDNKNSMHCMDWYATASEQDRYVHKSVYESVVIDHTHPRSKTALQGDTYDIWKIYDNTIRMNIGAWPGDFLNA